MSLSKLFQRIIFHNNTTPAINEDNLNAMSKAIDDIDDRVILIGDDVVTVIPQIQAYLEQAESIVEAVEELSQNPPYIGANGNWYVFDTTLEAYKDSGVDASITVDIADITMIAEGAQPYVTNTGTSTDPIFHLFLPRSPQGATGNGIANIAKTGTQGLVDTYTITMTDGTTYTFTVTNGQNGSGTGDMLQSDYDNDSTVKNAGGIADYVEENAVYQYPSNISSGSVLDALSLLYENCPYSHGIAMALLENSVTDRPVGNGWGILLLYNIDGTTSCHVRYQDTWSSKTVDGLFNYNASNPTVTWNAYLQDIISNPNLLDNPWFTVNQRGVTSFTDVGGGYSVDRWYHDANATGSISNGVYTCNVPTYQEWKDDRVTPLLGKVVTLSWLLSDGSIGSETKTLPSTLTSSYVWPFTNSYVVMGLHNNNLSQIARIQPNISIKAVKLELGSVSTLAMDTAPNYATELLKCQMSTADSSDAYANRNISGAELVLEQSQTLSTSADTVYTFTNSAITANSAVDVWTDIRGITPSNHVTTNGQSVVTFPPQSTAQTMTCRIYVK